MKIDAPGAPVRATTTTRHETISEGIYEQILQVAADAAGEQEFLSALTKEDRRALAVQLKKLLAGLEPTP
jgi:hypothetical protein